MPTIPHGPTAWLLAGSLLFAAPTTFAQDDERTFDRPDATDENMQTGPAVGEKIPDFDGLDQNDRRVSFDDVKGPNGALILFYRSADW